MFFPFCFNSKKNKIKIWKKKQKRICFFKFCKNPYNSSSVWQTFQCPINQKTDLRLIGRLFSWFMEPEMTFILMLIYFFRVHNKIKVFKKHDFQNFISFCFPQFQRKSKKKEKYIFFKFYTNPYTSSAWQTFQCPRNRKIDLKLIGNCFHGLWSPKWPSFWC